MNNKTNLTGSRLAGGNPVTAREENDFYATDPKSIRLFLDNHKIEGDSFYEPCSGQGHIAEVLKEYFPNAKHYASDLVDRGYGVGDVDFLKDDILNGEKVDWVITNPPFKLASDFIYRSLDITNKGVAMFLKLVFLESEGRKELFKNTPLKYVYVYSKRQNPMKEGLELNPTTGKKWSSTIAFAMFVWEHGYSGEPIIRWL